MGGGATVSQSVPPLVPPAREALIAAAREAAQRAYAPYSQFHVGAALAFADGSVVTGSNVENASYGLALCAETVAVSHAMNKGARGGLIAVAVIGGKPGARPATVTPCGRCRQVLNELAQLGGTDPVIWCAGGQDVLEVRLSSLLPHAFGPANLADAGQGGAPD
jgi:cytidine deaminase